MVLTLYHCAPSPPSRGALLTARAIGVDITISEVNLLNKEHLKPEFIKLNPQHTVPTLQDDDFVLWDSHAVSAYLVGRYAKDDSLYPKDLKKRAVVDQRLYFDASILFPRIRQICFPVLFLGEKSIKDEHKAQVQEALGLLDKFIGDNKWVAGDHLTIADIACVASVSTFVALGINISEHKNVAQWLSKCESEIPSYKEANQEGATYLGQTVLNKIASA